MFRPRRGWALTLLAPLFAFALQGCSTNSPAKTTPVSVPDHSAELDGGVELGVSPDAGVLPPAIGEVRLEARFSTLESAPGVAWDAPPDSRYRSYELSIFGYPKLEAKRAWSSTSATSYRWESAALEDRKQFVFGVRAVDAETGAKGPIRYSPPWQARSNVVYPLLYAQAGTYNVNVSTDAEIAEMAAVGMLLHLGQPTDTRRSTWPQVLDRHGAKLIDRDLGGGVLAKVCPTASTCALDAQTEKAALDWAQTYLDGVANDPRVVGFWILDDPPEIAIAPLLEKVRALVWKANATAVVKTRPTICGFGPELQRVGDPDLAKDAHPKMFQNYSPAACDVVTIYPYAWGAAGESPDHFDWTMSGLMKFVRTTLKDKGWDPARQPLIGMPQSFATRYDQAHRDSAGYVLPTADQITTQVRSFCEGGAIAIIPFMWTNPYSLSTSVFEFITPSNDPDVKLGAVRGFHQCWTIWEN